MIEVIALVSVLLIISALLLALAFIVVAVGSVIGLFAFGRIKSGSK